jgi:hypothetical protein
VAGKFEDGACVLVDAEDGGWTGPVKGSYFWWGVKDLSESLPEVFGESEDPYLPEVVGCLVGDGPYPRFAGGCSPIFEGDYDRRHRTGDREAALESAKEDALEIFRDVARGDASAWGLRYCNARTGESTDFEDSDAVASRDCEKVKRHFDKLEDRVG